MRNIYKYLPCYLKISYLCWLWQNFSYMWSIYILSSIYFIDSLTHRICSVYKTFGWDPSIPFKIIFIIAIFLAFVIFSWVVLHKDNIKLKVAMLITQQIVEVKFMFMFRLSFWLIWRHKHLQEKLFKFLYKSKNTFLFFTLNYF